MRALMPRCRNCVLCGNPIEGTGRIDRLYCSESCCTLAWRWRAGKRREEPASAGVMTAKQRREASIERNAIATLHAEVRHIRAKAAKEIKRLRTALSAEHELAAAREEKHRREMAELNTRLERAEARQRAAEMAQANAESRLQNAALLTTTLLTSNQVFVELAENASNRIADLEQVHAGRSAEELATADQEHRQPARTTPQQSRRRDAAVTRELDAEPEYFVFDAPAETNLLSAPSENSPTSHTQPNTPRLPSVPETKKKNKTKKRQAGKDQPRLASDKTDGPVAEQQGGSLSRAVKIGLGIGAGIGGAVLGLEHISKNKSRDKPRPSPSKRRQPAIEKTAATKKLLRSGS
jgi:hypothetical protein